MAATASKPKGSISIYFDHHYQKYHARIYLRGRKFHVGRFKSKKAAEKKAAKELNRIMGQEVSDFVDQLVAAGVI